MECIDITKRPGATAHTHIKLWTNVDRPLTQVSRTRSPVEGTLTDGNTGFDIDERDVQTNPDTMVNVDKSLTSVSRTTSPFEATIANNWTVSKKTGPDEITKPGKATIFNAQYMKQVTANRRNDIAHSHRNAIPGTNKLEAATKPLEANDASNRERTQMREVGYNNVTPSGVGHPRDRLKTTGANVSNEVGPTVHTPKRVHFSNKIEVIADKEADMVKANDRRDSTLRSPRDDATQPPFLIDDTPPIVKTGQFRKPAVATTPMSATNSTVQEANIGEGSDHAHTPRRSARLRARRHANIVNTELTTNVEVTERGTRRRNVPTLADSRRTAPTPLRLTTQATT